MGFVAKSLRLKLSYFWLLLFTYTFLILYISKRFQTTQIELQKKRRMKEIYVEERKGNKWKIQNQIYFEDTMVTHTHLYATYRTYNEIIFVYWNDYCLKRYKIQKREKSQKIFVINVLSKHDIATHSDFKNLILYVSKNVSLYLTQHVFFSSPLNPKNLRITIITKWDF